jgi:chromate transporter
VDKAAGAPDNAIMNVVSSPLSLPPAVSAAAHSRPASLRELFIAFTWLALQGFGGVLVVVQRELVERKQWLTHEEFIEDWAVAQVMPGPNVVNLALMYGGRVFGLAGALTALAGLLACPLIVVLLLAVLHARFASNPAVEGALRGMAAVSAGLIGAVGLKLAAALRTNPVPPGWSIAICIAGFILVALLHVPLLYVMLVLGGLGCVLAYRRLHA